MTREGGRASDRVRAASASNEHYREATRGSRSKIPVNRALTISVGVASLVWDRARSGPNTLAVAEPLGGTAFTYRELWERAGSLAAELAEAGISRGDLVAIDMPRSAELVVAFLGIVRAGAAYLPLDAQAPASRVADILTESGARVVVCRSREGSRAAGKAVHRLTVPQAEPAAEVHQPPRRPWTARLSRR